MKGIQISKRLSRLGSRGSAHIIVPMLAVMVVGVAGAYTLVSSHAATATLAPGSSSNAPAATSAAKLKKGRVAIYSESGRYNTVHISVANTTTPQKCGGTITTANPTMTKKLPVPKKGTITAKPAEFSCDPIGGTAQYNIFYGKGTKYNAGYVAIDVDKGYCTLVHPDASLTTKLPLTDKGTCPPAATDAPEKTNVTLRSLPVVAKGAKTISGYADLQVAGESLTRAQCTGEVTVTYTEAIGSGKSHTFHDALKYVKPKAADSNGYCVATLKQNKVSTTKLEVGTIYTVAVDFGGSPFFNPASASAQVAVPVTK